MNWKIIHLSYDQLKEPSDKPKNMGKTLKEYGLRGLQPEAQVSYTNNLKRQIHVHMLMISGIGVTISHAKYYVIGF